MRHFAVALLSCVTLASSAGAQSPRTITYLYLRGADTIATEELTITDSSVSGVLAARVSAPRLNWTQLRQGTALGMLKVAVFPAGTVTGATPLQEATFRVVGDSVRVELSAGGNATKQTVATKAGAVVLVNQSLMHASLVASRASRAGQTSIDLFSTTGAQTLTAALAKRGDTLVLTIAGTESRILTDAGGLPREVLVPSQNSRVVRATSPVSQPAAAAPPNYDAPAGAGYTAEHVRIPTGRGYELAATYTRPTLNRTVGVAITISGSGPQERDGRVPIVPGYAIFRDIADTLARRGIATLRYDDRGIGQSGGLESARTATSADFADDVRSVIAWLLKRPDVNGAHIGLIGHSEGGMIAPMVAASAASGVQSIVLLAGQAYSGRRVSMFQNKEGLDATPGLTPAVRDSIWKSIPARLDSAGAQNRWLGFYLSHDPIATIRKVKQPVLVLQGETDHQVTPEQADSLLAALKASGNTKAAMRKFPSTNHLFLNDPSGKFQGYAALKDTHVRREVLGAIADFFVAQFR